MVSLSLFRASFTSTYSHRHRSCLTRDCALAVPHSRYVNSHCVNESPPSILLLPTLVIRVTDIISQTFSSTFCHLIQPYSFIKNNYPTILISTESEQIIIKLSCAIFVFYLMQITEFNMFIWNVISYRWNKRRKFV